MNKYKHIIGIDPDVDKSGVAYLEVETKVLEISNLTFPLLLDYLRFVKKESEEKGESVVVVVEAGWLNKSNWHVQRGEKSSIAAKIGNSTGRNHETGHKIIEMCRFYELDVIEQKPLSKIWKGKDKKISHEELAYFTGIMGKTNQDARDAALLAWNQAGLPVKIKGGKLKNK